MKKTISIVLMAAMLLLAMTGCASKKAQEAEVTEELVGGWTTPEDSAMTDELQAIFDEAAAQWNGINLEAVELLGTQVVAGVNYRFLAQSTVDGTTTQYTVTVYKDLQGNVELTSVEENNG